MALHCFKETREAAEDLTELFNFIWPTAAALWNLRWQVAGFIQTVPDVTTSRLNERFIAGSGVSGADLKKLVSRSSWEDQQEQFARFILQTAFSIYEGWGRQLTRKFNIAGFDERDLYRIGNGFSKGTIAFLNTAQQANSVFMQNCFYDYLLNNNKYATAPIELYLYCYTYFKEARNCQVHNNGIFDARAVEAYKQYVTNAPTTGLGLQEELVPTEAREGEIVKLGLRSVVGFCEIIIILITTIDAELAKTSIAEEDALERMKATIKTRPVLNSREQRRNMQVRSICKKIRLPPPADVALATQIMINNNIVSR